MRHLAMKFAALLAPPVCTLCQGDGQQYDEIWGIDLCHCCEAACTAIAPACQRCAMPGNGSPVCAGCLQHPPPFDAAFCPFRYQDPVDLLITNLKFRHELAPARVLGMLFARRWNDSDRKLPDCLVPMPLHPSRLRERGFNQAAEIARHLAPRIKSGGRALPVRGDLLQRVRATDAQTSLSAALRASNLAGAFSAGNAAALPAHVALLDDVMTTGSTAAAAALALKLAGCTFVEVWACARAVPRSP